MRKKTTVFIGLIIILVLFLEYILGSNWHFTTSERLIVYQRNDLPLDKSPIVAKMKKADSLVVEKCFFDKDDAYMLVKTNDGITGYAFETRQFYINDWMFPSFIFSKDKFIRNLTCWRPIGQFGLK